MLSTTDPVTVKRRLIDLLSSRMIRFAGVGAFGTVLNLAIMAAMQQAGAHYLLAAILATELTILTNFLMHERLVFDSAVASRPFWQRLLVSFGFNNLETLIRIPVLVLLVETLLVPGVLAQALTLAVAFVVRFIFTSRVIYKVRSAVGLPVATSLVPAIPTPADSVDPVDPVGVKLA
jgi:putative flippase GtrA